MIRARRWIGGLNRWLRQDVRAAVGALSATSGIQLSPVRCRPAVTRAKSLALAPTAAGSGASIAAAKSDSGEIETIEGRLAVTTGTCA